MFLLTSVNLMMNKKITLINNSNPEFEILMTNMDILFVQEFQQDEYIPIRITLEFL